MQGNNEIAVCGALSASYIDMYRVKCAAAVNKPYTLVHKDFAYTGKDWRLKKSAERAAQYSLAQLREAVELLAQLDFALNSSAVSKQILLENAVTELLSL